MFPLTDFGAAKVSRGKRNKYRAIYIHQPVIVVVDLSVFIFKFLPISWQRGKHCFYCNPKKFLVLIDIHPQVLSKFIYLLVRKKRVR